MHAMDSPKGRARRFWTWDAKVVAWAALSRIVLVVLSVLLDYALPDHNPDSSVARLPGTLTLPRWLLAFTRWDAAHFLRIAHSGYEEEKDFAFFPLLPLAMNGFAHLLHAAGTSWGLSLLLSGLLITNGCFVLSAWLLFRLGLALLKDHLLAVNAARLFCLCPANIFFSSIYTESPFAACTFGALLSLHLDRFYLGAMLFGMGSCLRSNGLVNAGFLACHVVASTLKQRQQSSSKVWIRAASRCLFGTILVVFPFVAFQAFAVWTECNRDAQNVCSAQDQCVSGPPSWCQSSIPAAYSHIQAKYWQGGFLRYWQLKQIPNFLLAAPALGLAAAAVSHLFIDFFKELRRVEGSKGSKQPKNTITLVAHVSLLRCPLFPHALHLGFLAMYLLCFANVQIATRLLASACPVFHWFLASIVFDRSQKFRRLLQLYIGLYNLLGVSMHVNFLPWT
eukprot:Skav216537  [mRNA]  locus=scaffold1776:65559:66908:+ [translate_table: standard]